MLDRLGVGIPHQILRPFADVHAEGRYIEPGTEPTTPAIGLPVPNSYEVVIPDVATAYVPNSR